MSQPQHEIDQGFWLCPWCGETTHVVCAMCSCTDFTSVASPGDDAGAPVDKCQPGERPGDSPGLGVGEYEEFMRKHATIDW